MDNSASLTMVDEEIHIVDEEEMRQNSLGWQPHMQNIRLDMASAVP